MRSAAAPRVLLVGMMAAGKTSLGRALSDATGWPYLDNDELVERATGRPTPEVLAGGDEATLRAAEAAALDEALAAEPPVIAGVAGGVVTDPELRRRLAAEGFVVYLRAPVELLVERVGRGSDRPWLQGDPAAALQRLFEGREERYVEVADLVLDVADVPLDELVGRVLDALDRTSGRAPDPRTDD